MPSPVVGHEYRTINECENLDKIKKFLSENPSEDKTKETLGLHWHRKEARVGNYIGVVWIGDDDRVPLRVDSKFENPTMDYMKMFSECCAHPVVGEKMYGCFDVWPEQESIEIPNADNFSFMVVVAFLRELNTLCIRHLRRHFHRKQENFIGKVKGKILISENIRRNIGHAERMFCEYQSISDDILENRILRAALEKVARYLSAFQKESEGYPTLLRWVHSCRSHLGGVSVVHIARRDIGKAKNRGAFTPYRRPLHLAKAVLCHLGFNPHAEQKKPTKTPPYCINSAKLFECYAELQLRKEFFNIKAQEKINYTKDGFSVSIIPDFYVPRQAKNSPCIIDAKYKDIRKEFKENKNSKDGNSDVYQVVAYSQHFGLLREINEDHDDPEDAEGIVSYLAYPWLKDMPWPSDEFTDAFKTKVRIHKIKCPVVESSTDNGEN